MIFKKKYDIAKFVLSIAMLCAMPIIVQAKTESSVLQAYITEETATIITDNSWCFNELECSISNQNAEIIQTGLLSDTSALVETTILIDVSTSMPSSMRENVIIILKKLIEDKPANEEFKIVVFGDKINILQDFTSDRYELASIIDKIEFSSKQSIIYDAIYNTIPTMTQIDKKPTFYRTIIITDGVDDTISGITKEELLIRLQNERYPVDIVVVSNEEIAENKELAAIVRISNSNYETLNENTDISLLAQSLGVTNYSFIEVNVPEFFLDGITRQMDFEDGTYRTSIDIKFPVFKEAFVSKEGEDEPKLSTEEASNTPSTMLLSLTEEKEQLNLAENIGDEYKIVFFVGVGIVLFAIAIVTIVMTIIKRRKHANAQDLQTSAMLSSRKDFYSEKTEFISESSNSKLQYTIKLSNPNDSSKIWMLPIVGDVLIGRTEYCSVCLDDKSVSREQCKIMIQGDSLVVLHLGSTNKTLLNGKSVTNSLPLHSGDTLKLGRATLHVDYIQTVGSVQQNLEAPHNQVNDKTESIF